MLVEEKLVVAEEKLLELQKVVVKPPRVLKLAIRLRGFTTLS